jgi:hypothetical protein
MGVSILWTFSHRDFSPLPAVLKLAVSVSLHTTLIHVFVLGPGPAFSHPSSLVHLRLGATACDFAFISSHSASLLLCPILRRRIPESRSVRFAATDHRALPDTCSLIVFLGIMYNPIFGQTRAYSRLFSSKRRNSEPGCGFSHQHFLRNC